ncbi:hypothetical protein Tco_0303752 [Tanacetum coccineum]
MDIFIGFDWFNIDIGISIGNVLHRILSGFASFLWFCLLESESAVMSVAESAALFADVCLNLLYICCLFESAVVCLFYCCLAVLLL